MVVALFIVQNAKKLLINLYMKTKIFVPVFIVSLIMFSAPVFAQNNTTVKTTRSQVGEVKSETKTTVDQIKEEKRLELSEAKQKKIQSVYEALKNGLEKRHTTLLKIKDKIQARIDKNPMNKDVTAAKAELAKFDAAESQYQTDLSILGTKFTGINSSANTVSTTIKSLKDTVTLIRTDLNNIKKILTSTVTALAKAPKLTVTETK